MKDALRRMIRANKLSLVSLIVIFLLILFRRRPPRTCSAPMKAAGMCSHVFSTAPGSAC